MPVMKLIIFAAAVCLYGSASAQQVSPKLTLLVEENYPHASRDEVSGQIVGEEVDLVVSLTNAAGIDYSMAILPWNRAFRRARTEPNTCLLPINHTPERDHMFQWVSPTQVGGWAIYQRADDNITLNTIKDMAQYKVVGKMSSQATADIEMMINKPILRAAGDVEAAQMLYRKRADLLISGVRDNLSSTQNAGLPRLKKVLDWKPAKFGLACSHKTDKSIIEKLRAANRQRLAALEQ